MLRAGGVTLEVAVRDVDVVLQRARGYDALWCEALHWHESKRRGDDQELCSLQRKQPRGLWVFAVHANQTPKADATRLQRRDLPELRATYYECMIDATQRHTEIHPERHTERGTIATGLE